MRSYPLNCCQREHGHEKPVATHAKQNLTMLIVNSGNLMKPLGLLGPAVGLYKKRLRDAFYLSSHHNLSQNECKLDKRRHNTLESDRFFIHAIAASQTKDSLSAFPESTNATYQSRIS